MRSTLLHLRHWLSPAAVAALASVVVSLAGLMMLTNWFLNLLPLERVGAAIPPMSPLAAAGLILAGAALGFLRNENLSLWRRNLGGACAGSAGLIGLLMLCQYFWGRDFGFDGLIVFTQDSDGRTRIFNRQSFQTALSLALVGASLLLLDVSPRRGPQPAQLLTLVDLHIVLLVLLGHAAGNRALYVVDSKVDAGMPWHAALLTTLLCVGILCARSHSGFTKVILSRGGGGVVARRLLSIPILVPLTVGLISWAGHRAGLVSREFGGWLFAVGYFVAFTFIIWWVASVIQRSELKRSRSEARLADANLELEAFCSSVSHDLRAPLRSIDGFSKALLEDCFDRLDDDGKDYLKRVRAASQRMGELIDDLLNLSRVHRAELRRSPIDLSRLAQEVANGLHTTHPERCVDWSIAPSVLVEGDKNLLTILLENLLGNAFKYSSKAPQARIEFGQTTENGQTAYFVKDNGAGFDMAYAGKLFQPFQRLHRPDEFAGHGIGLATVQRIVHRHGGRVWARGSVGNGAVFYFTLDGSHTGDNGRE